MATAKIEVPKVYTAMASVLEKLSVAKGGMLPSSMGAKPYITAADTSREVKTLFVENDLVVTPFERVYKHEIITLNNRITIAMVIEGEYTFTSTVDGSSVTVQGVGDGLANGTAVASNIASTNALKNALLRTFLITEQSVEDYSKNGIDESVPAQPKAVATAKGGATRKAEGGASTGVTEIRDQIKELVAKVAEETDVAPDYAAIGNRLFPGKQWANSVSDLKAVLKAIQDGEVS